MDDITTTVLSVPSQQDYVSFSSDGTLRSPHTPTWSPPQISSPFEYDRFLSMSTSTSTSSSLSGAASSQKRPSLPPPPENPLPWVWQCHLCRNRYPLGVTRRCLYDGHYYCSGESAQPNLKKKKGRACSSEFDYEGWEAYGDWCTRALRVVENPKVQRGCETCKFPSQCRTPAVLMPVVKKDKKKTKLRLGSLGPKPEGEVAAVFEAIEDNMARIESGDATMTEANEVAAAVPVSGKANAMLDFDSILKDLMRDEEGLSPNRLTHVITEAADSGSASSRSSTNSTSSGASPTAITSSPTRGRSLTKERNFSKKFNISSAPSTVDEEEREREAVAQSLSGLVTPMFEILSGKGKKNSTS